MDTPYCKKFVIPTNGKDRRPASSRTYGQIEPSAGRQSTPTIKHFKEALRYAHYGKVEDFPVFVPILVGNLVNGTTDILAYKRTDVKSVGTVHTATYELIDVEAYPTFKPTDDTVVLKIEKKNDQRCVFKVENRTTSIDFECINKTQPTTSQTKTENETMITPKKTAAKKTPAVKKAAVKKPAVKKTPVDKATADQPANSEPRGYEVEDVPAKENKEKPQDEASKGAKVRFLDEVPCLFLGVKDSSQTPDGFIVSPRRDSSFLLFPRRGEYDAKPTKTERALADSATELLSSDTCVLVFTPDQDLAETVHVKVPAGDGFVFLPVPLDKTLPTKDLKFVLDSSTGDFFRATGNRPSLLDSPEETKEEPYVLIATGTDLQLKANIVLDIAGSDSCATTLIEVPYRFGVRSTSGSGLGASYLDVYELDGNKGRTIAYLHPSIRWKFLGEGKSRLSLDYQGVTAELDLLNFDHDNWLSGLSEAFSIGSYLGMPLITPLVHGKDWVDPYTLGLKTQNLRLRETLEDEGSKAQTSLSMLKSFVHGYDPTHPANIVLDVGEAFLKDKMIKSEDTRISYEKALIEVVLKALAVK